MSKVIFYIDIHEIVCMKLTCRAIMRETLWMGPNEIYVWTLNYIYNKSIEVCISDEISAWYFMHAKGIQLLSCMKLYVVRLSVPELSRIIWFVRVENEELIGE